MERKKMVIQGVEKDSTKLSKNKERSKKIKSGDIRTSIRFKNQEEKDKLFHWAREVLLIPFSDAVKMFFKEDMEGTRNIKNMPEDMKNALEQVKFENQALKEQISILKQDFSVELQRAVKQILQTINKPAGDRQVIEEIKGKIMDLLNNKIENKRVKMSLTEISLAVHHPENQVLDALNELQSKENVKLFSNMKFGRID